MTQWEQQKGDKKTVLMSSKALLSNFLSDRFLCYLVETVFFIAIWLSVFTSLFIFVWFVQSKMFESITSFYFYSDTVSLQKYYSKVPDYLLWLQNKIFVLNHTFSMAGVLVTHWKIHFYVLHWWGIMKLITKYVRGWSWFPPCVWALLFLDYEWQ